MTFFSNGPIQADAAKAQPSFAPIPEGTYTLNIVKCTDAPSKNGDPMLTFTFEVDPSTPEYGGRKLMAWVLLKFADKLHALMLMAGMTEAGDATDFFGRTIVAKVKVKQRRDTGELVNEVELRKPDAPVAPSEQKKMTPTQPTAGGTW